MWCILLLLFSNGYATSINETLKVQLNYPFFKFFSKNGHHLVDQEIPKITVPNITLPFTTAVGSGVVTTNELKIDKFQQPNIDFVLSDNGISWYTKRGAVKLRGLWGATFTEVVTVSDSGWLTATAYDIRMNISAKIYQLDGQPQVQIGACTVDIVHLDVEIGGSVLSWLVNIFRSPFSTIVRKIIHSQACIAATGILEEEANRFLHSLPSHVDIGKNFYLDYHLVDNPIYSPQYASFDFSADIVYGKSTCYPVQLSNWTDIGPDPGMITVWISESIANCLLKSAHENQLVKYLVTKDIPTIEPYLKTTCGIFGICIGRFFSKLRTDYPNQYIDLLFHTHQTPIFTMSQSEGAKLNMSLAADLYINPYSKSKQNILARILVDTVSDVVPYLNNSRIYGNLLNCTITAKQDFSNIGDVSERFLQMFADVLSVTVKQIVKTVLTVGLPIPSYDNITVSDTSKIDIFDHYTRVNVNFQLV